MVTGFSLGNVSTPGAAIGNPLSRNGKRSRQRRRQHGWQRLRVLSTSAAVLSTAILVCVWHHTANDDEGPRSDGAASRNGWEEEIPPRRQSSLDGGAPERESNPPGGNDEHTRRARPSPGTAPKTGVRTASIDAVVGYLNELADAPVARLWDALGAEDADRGEDPFSLRELEAGKCPWSSTVAEAVDWLPPRPFDSETMAARYRSTAESLKKNGRARIQQYDARNEVALWYEHMSKAGGTTFCGLAQSNMQDWQVPRYHCMPRKGKLYDGRVGSWPNEELVEHLTENKHAIVSNEWEPFSLEKLELSGRHLDGAASTTRSDGNLLGPRLLFLTTLRDTQDRLLSAYTFFVFTSNKKSREEEGSDAPTFDQWIGKLSKHAKGNKQGSVRMKANLGRMNHIVWRFSGGKLSHSPKLDEESTWKPAFETAIRALSQHDLILPMDVMTKEQGKTALHQLLGWDRFDVKSRHSTGDKEGGHVVTTGGIQNSNAREHFSKEKYRALWEENWLDNILYVWCRAVFLARLHCKDVIVEPS